MESFSIAHPAEGTDRKTETIRSRWHRAVDAIAVSVRFHRWRLGFRQYSFRHIVRALRDGTVSVF